MTVQETVLAHGLSMDEVRENVRLYTKFEGKVAGLDGYAINAMDVAQGCYEAGWHDELVLGHALATFASESLYYTQAFHHNIDSDGNTDSTDWGPCQLNDKAHPQFFPGGDHMVIACDPKKCWAAAYTVWHDAGGSFDPWYGWKNGVALDDYYLRRAGLGSMNFVARDLAKLAAARPTVVNGRKTPPTKTRTPMETLSELRRIYPPGT